MSRKIIGVTVGTTINPQTLRDRLKPVTSINGVAPDESGNVELPSYNGEFEIVPSTNSDITLLTSQTFVDANIKVNKIPYAEVSNNSGGMTATIGKEV